MFLSKVERDYLTANRQFSEDYRYTIKPRLQKKVQQFAREELPLWVEQGYLDLTEFCKLDLTENCKVSSAIAAQLAEGSFASYGGYNNNERKSPKWDSNPRPKVSTPPPLMDERGITKPSPRKESDTGSITPRSLQELQQFCDWLKIHGKTRWTIKQTKDCVKKYGHIINSGDCSG